MVEIARRRQATEADRNANQNFKDDVRVKYSVTDWDVLNFTDEVKRKLRNRSNLHLGFAYGTSATQATLGALAGAAETFGWGLSAASGLGLGATYVFGMSRIFDPKGNAQAYEQSFTAVQAAEATYYFHQLGMGFDKVSGRVLPGNSTGRSDIPSQTNLTPDGETLYYRVSKILKVLSDTLASKIPDLQDLKDAHGESTVSGSPAKPTDAAPVWTPSSGGPRRRPPLVNQPADTGQTLHQNAIGAADAISDDPGKILQQFCWPGGTKNDQNFAQLRNWMDDNGLKNVDPATLIHARQYSAQRRDAVKSLHLFNTYLRDPAGVALQQYCWPAGVKNGQNIAVLRKWMSDNGLGSIEIVSFIHSGDYASQRRNVVQYLHLSDAYSRDAGVVVLQQYCWPGGVKNDQNLAALRKWMDDNALAGVDPVVFIHAAQYVVQRKAAITALRLSNSYTRDVWEIKLQNFCWPSGRENTHNMDKLRAWMNSNSLVDVDFASFIHGQQYVSQRRDAVGYLHL